MFLDPTTGLHSKLGFQRIIQYLIDKRQENSFIVVLSLEISGGSINLLDEEVKRSFLKKAIVRLKTDIPDNNTLSILNSSEFAFIMIDSSTEEVIRTLTCVIDAFLNYLMVDGHPMPCELRAGYSCYPSCESEPNELLRMAYIALYQAKNTPTRKPVGYQDAIVQELRLHLELAHCLPRAIELGEFVLYFQPIVNSTKLDEPIQHYEALIRWEHPVKGVVPPDHFIEIAEKSGDIIAIGYWVIHEVCRCLSQPSVPKNVGVSINLSPVQFKEEMLVQNIAEIIKGYGISTNRITIEITETSAMQDNELTKEKFSEFHAEGFKLSMDDFGTGYSSLSYLLNFHFDIIKIDKSFIDNTLVDVQYEIIAQTVVKLAHDLDLTVICEGIETDQQYKMVSEWKTDMIQGYLISKPKPWSEFYKN
nr:GGDEF domain-containing phosphodiesterase [Shewanella nanhaiensis]